MHHWFKKKKKETTFQGEQKACIKISDQFQDALLISETLEVRVHLKWEVIVLISHWDIYCLSCRLITDLHSPSRPYNFLGNFYLICERTGNLFPVLPQTCFLWPQDLCHNPFYAFTNWAPGELSALFSVIPLNSFPSLLEPFDLPGFVHPP